MSGVARVHGDVAALAAAHRVPVGNHPEAAAGGHRDGGVVLLRTVDAVGPLVVHEDPVDLRGFLFHQAGPALSPVEGDIRAAVVGVDHVHRVVRVDPEVVVVAVRHADALGEGLAAVNGLVETHIQPVHGVLVLRVGVDVDVVPGALAQVGVAVDPGPAFAAVVRAVEAALFALRLDQRPDAVRVRRRDRNRGLAEDPGRKAAFDLLPTVAAVLAAVDAAIFAPGDHRPGFPLGAPGAGVEDARVVRVQLDVHETGAVGEEEHLFPALAAIGGAEHPALLVRSEDVAERGGVGGVRILGMDGDGADLSRIPKAEVPPGLPGVGRAVDAVADRDVAARAHGPRAHIDDIHIGRRDLDGADRATPKKPSLTFVQLWPASEVLKTPPPVPPK